MGAGSGGAHAVLPKFTDGGARHVDGVRVDGGAAPSSSNSSTPPKLIWGDLLLGVLCWLGVAPNMPVKSRTLWAHNLARRRMLDVHVRGRVLAHQPKGWCDHKSVL